MLGYLDNIVSDVTEYNDFDLWDSVYPFSYSLKGSSLRFPAPPITSVPPPQLELLSESFDPKTNLRTITIRFNYKGHEWTTVRFKADLESWSPTSELPPTHDGFYILRHVAAQTSSYQVTFTYRGKDPLELHISATHFGTSPYLEKLLSQLPEWTDDSAFISQLATWKL